MSIDPSRLGPNAQRQILQKLGEIQRAKEEKYHNKADQRVAKSGKAITFKSQKEAARYDELMLLLKAGKIRDLRLQPQYTLQEAYTTPEGEHIYALKYVADFSYEERVMRKYQQDGGYSYEYVEEWELVVEDVKSRPTRTQIYITKKKLMREKYGITIREV